ncbi:MAG: SMC-Scp complex subunit ScpB [Fibrobacteres bacterium]|nr:SMC-Scp complex subunit ScpB [Fibrobacterota bacterium]
MSEEEDKKPLELDAELTDEDLNEEANSEDSLDTAEIEANLPSIVEAIIFASDEPINAQTLKDLLKINIESKRLRTIISDINRKLQADRRPFEISEHAGGFQYRTITAYQKYLKGLFKDKAVRRLSGQALETLAIIAYKQPVSKAEIEAIRSVNTESSMKTLLEKRLIKLLGKSEEKPGKPIVYGTTKDFLKYFGLNRISDLPKLEEFEEIAKSSSKTELIQDFKRDTERTETLAPASAIAEMPEEAVPQEGEEKLPESDGDELTEAESEEYRIAEEAEANPADDALPPEDSESENEEPATDETTPG